ncbi:MAG TPA: flavodoxin family protein, partial [Desulfobacteraceae bacterium]|nr:flavodoxin family protein [Desulfobacteraceae bacterium]
MQVLILYYSRSNNTKKLAEAVAEGVASTGVTAVLKNTEEVEID